MPSSSGTAREAAELPSESAPGASGLPTHPPTSSPTATTRPTTHPAASFPTTTPPVAKGNGLTGAPDPTHGVDTCATTPPEAHQASEPVVCGSSYIGIHEPTPDAFLGVPGVAPPPTMPAYTVPEHGLGFTSLGDLCGPGSCGGRSRESRRSSEWSLTRPRKILRGVTKDLTRDLTQEIKAKLDPLIPPQGSPMTTTASPHRIQANYLVAGPTHTLRRVRSRPMPTPAAIPRSTFVPKTAPLTVMCRTQRARSLINWD